MQTSTDFTPNLTKLEREYMDLIAYCEMNTSNGSRPESYIEVNTYNWADERAAELGISEKALGGVMASLAQKGLIDSYPAGRDDPDGGVWFTEEGFKVWEVGNE